MNIENWRSKIFTDLSEEEFNKLAIEAFRYQSSENAIYKQFIELNNVDIDNILNYTDIPFIPIELFKNHIVSCFNSLPSHYFESSGTTSSNKSRHYFNTYEIYEDSFNSGFRHFFGNIEDYVLLALLPNYMEQKNSSLIYMIDYLIKRTDNKLSDFYLSDFEKLNFVLNEALKSGKRVILFGVTYALLDFSEYKKNKYPELIIFETGGMKGRRKELTRSELHGILKASFGVSQIYGEYGMAELFSQAYSFKDGIFRCPPWMKVLIREANDPKTILKANKTGGINVIDLANIQSCCFIATQDIGIKYDDDTFEVLGRFDNSDIRGCNTMITG